MCGEIVFFSVLLYRIRPESGYHLNLQVSIFLGYVFFTFIILKISVV